jgi:hypothetical protein
MRTYKTGDLVIYRKPKHSSRPGPRAEEISPAAKGETYDYVVDKFWIVADVTEDDRLLLRTRKGKERLVEADDPRLRRPTWWERLVFAGKFPRLDQPKRS